MDFSSLTMPILTAAIGIFFISEIWIKHREKMSDALRENEKLKKEIEALKSQKKEA